MNDQAAQMMMPVVVQLPAEIDVTNCEHVYNQLVEVLTPGVDLVIADMMGTTFCDSSGVASIVRAYETAAARDIQLRLAVSQRTSVSRVLQLIGVSRMMPVYESLEKALNAAA